jgi:hypothetical protein
LHRAGLAQTDAAAKAGEKGAAHSGAVEVTPGVWVYEIPKNGLALQSTLQGTKYYKNDECDGNFWRRGGIRTPGTRFSAYNGLANELCGLVSFLFSRLGRAIVGYIRVFGAGQAVIVK